MIEKEGKHDERKFKKMDGADAFDNNACSLYDRMPAAKKRRLHQRMSLPKKRLL